MKYKQYFKVLKKVSFWDFWKKKISGREKQALTSKRQCKSSKAET